jgi:hypothetical protein
MKINAISKFLGGKQQLVITKGHVIPSSVRNGLLQMGMRPPTESEMRTLEHVLFTSDSPWDPKCIDNKPAIDASLDDDSDVLLSWIVKKTRTLSIPLILGNILTGALCTLTCIASSSLMMTFL